ncbi:hypothetical protein CEXT_166671 [Caerostris extrusa]|uniref:Transmembrane protein n=1 Tax=Caerostris extrusa TaxID=172846 RepID=A0AAV4SWV9_CAEEX|nr:hypothetical protein CEXT_166671 [Caerostris extrusa]
MPATSANKRSEREKSGSMRRHAPPLLLRHLFEHANDFEERRHRQVSSCTLCFLKNKTMSSGALLNAEDRASDYNRCELFPNFGTCAVAHFLLRRNQNNERERDLAVAFSWSALPAVVYVFLLFDFSFSPPSCPTKVPFFFVSYYRLMLRGKLFRVRVQTEITWGG